MELGSCRGCEWRSHYTKSHWLLFELSLASHAALSYMVHCSFFIRPFHSLRHPACLLVVMFSSSVVPDLAIPSSPTCSPPALPSTDVLIAAPYSSLPLFPTYPLQYESATLAHTARSTSLSPATATDTSKTNIRGR